jgi:hypothetical protein
MNLVRDMNIVVYIVVMVSMFIIMCVRIGNGDVVMCLVMVVHIYMLEFVVRIINIDMLVCMFKFVDMCINMWMVRVVGTEAVGCMFRVMDRGIIVSVCMVTVMIIDTNVLWFCARYKRSCSCGCRYSCG